MPDVLPSPQQTGDGVGESVRPARVAFLINIIAPYHKPLFDRLARRYECFRIFLSTPMEENRAWKLAWDGLDVKLQKTVTIRRRWRHPQGFSEPLFVHLPLDTVGQLARFRPQVVVSWEMGARTMLAALYRRLHPRSRLLVWAEFAESTEYGRGKLRGGIRRILHRAVDGFIVTGRSGARYLEALGVPARKLYPIIYTTDVARFAAAPLPRTRGQVLRLLYVGQFIERKGLQPFLDVLAASAADGPDRLIEFVLAGSGPLRSVLEHAVLPPNLRLRFLGDVGYEALPEVYASADIFVFPTLADTWGVVVNEALASGLPVLGSLQGQAVSELIAEGVNGWTFRASSREDMRRALERALATPPHELQRMAEQARAAALRITPDVVAGMVDRAIVSCCGDQRVNA